MDTSTGQLLHLRLLDHCRRWGRKIVNGKGYEGVCCEIVSSRNVRSYTYQVSPTWLPKQKLKKGNNKCTIIDNRRKLRRHQPYTKIYSQPKNAEGKRSHLPKRKSILVGYPMLNSQPWEHTQTSNFIQTEQDVFMWGKKRDHAFDKEQRGVYGRGWEDRRGGERWCSIVISKDKRNTFQKHNTCSKSIDFCGLYKSQ